MPEEAISIRKSLRKINVCVLLLGGTSMFVKLITLPVGERRLKTLFEQNISSH